MNTAAIVTTSALLSAAVSFGVAWFLVPERASNAPPTEAVTTGEARFAELQQEISGLRERLNTVTLQPVGVLPGRAELPSLSEAQFAAAMDRYIASQPDSEKRASMGLVSRRGRLEQPEPESVTDLFAAMMSGERTSESIWAAAKASGRVDELIEQFKQHVTENPNDPDAQVMLGDAYLQKLVGLEPGPEMGALSNLSDKAYDEALDINPQHWDARFNKAVSYTFWPKFMGKTGDAMQHFNTLIEQQEAAGAMESKHANTYFFLANLYDEQGRGDEAKSLRGRAKQRFPDDVRFKE